MPVVHVNLIKGRTKEQKKAIAGDITESIHKNAGSPKEVIIVVFHDIDGDSWMINGRAGRRLNRRTALQDEASTANDDAAVVANDVEHAIEAFEPGRLNIGER